MTSPETRPETPEKGTAPSIPQSRGPGEGQAPPAAPSRSDDAALAAEGARGRRARPDPGASVWWLSLIAGIVWVLWGLLVLSLRPSSFYSVAVLAGVSFIFGGVGQFLLARRVDSWRWLFYVGGVLGILGGILAFVWPGITLLVLAVFVAWYLVIGGIFTVVGAFVGPKRDLWWMAIILGVLMFLLGAWAIGSPGRELLLLVNLVGFYMIFNGINEIFSAFAARSGRVPERVAS
jgi:MFS family permease